MSVWSPFAGSHRSLPCRLPSTDGRNGTESGVCGSSVYDTAAGAEIRPPVMLTGIDAF